MKASPLISAIVLALAVSACGGPFKDHFAGPIDGTLHVTPLSEGAPKLRPYRIQLGDSLDVKFYRAPELDSELKVRPDGMISLPLLDDVEAAGHTPQALSDELERKYGSELYNPSVTVAVTEFAGQRVYVGGQVESPGEYELPPGMTLMQAIQKAGGFKDDARKAQTILIRREGNEAPKGTSIDLAMVESGLHPGVDVELAPYDIVHVPRSSIGNTNLFVEQYITRNLPGGFWWANALFF